MFAGCVALSSAIWAGGWLAARVAFGDRVAALLDRYEFVGYLAFGVLAAGTVVFFVVRWRTTQRG
jgi:membrane protein DedA with SNARE-associated domain